jgi:hypothetical protein
MKYSVKNNMNYTQDGCGGGYEGHNVITSLSSKLTAILTAIMSNSASHFGGRNGFIGGGSKLFPWEGIAPPPQIYS